VPLFLSATFQPLTASAFDWETLYAGYHWDQEVDWCSVRYRILLPHLGCWNQPDPLEQGGGDENYRRYVGNNPLIFADPFGALKVTPVSGGNNLDKVKCGEAVYLQWTFSLTTNAPCEGFIVQRVESLCESDGCVKNCCHPSRQYQRFVYWEAWPVHKNESLSYQQVQGGYAYTDRAAVKLWDGTCGSHFQSGEIRFYCKASTGNLLMKWRKGASYGQGRCNTSPGKLVSTDVEPNFWGKAPVEGPASRLLSINFNCCKCQDDWAPTVPPGTILAW